jgi:hypothetical protein
MEKVMPNIMIGEEKVNGMTMCFDSEDKDWLRDTAKKHRLKGVSALVRAFKSAYEMHPKEMASFIEEARSEGRKIQSEAKKEILKIAIRRAKDKNRPKYREREIV